MPRRLVAALLAAAVSSCSGGITTSARPGLGQVRMVPFEGQVYPVRVTPGLAGADAWTRIVAPAPITAQRIYAGICERRPHAPSDWPEGRLARDSATGEWAVRGDCPGMALAG